MTELYWPNDHYYTDRRRQYEVKRAGVYELPDPLEDENKSDVEDAYRERGWVDADEAPDDSASADTQAERDHSGAQRAGSANEDVSPSDADESDESGAESADTAEAQADEEFNAYGFIDGEWNEVAEDIRSGEADGNLNAVRSAEEGRDPGSRNSVVTALDEREHELAEEDDDSDSDSE